MKVVLFFFFLIGLFAVGIFNYDVAASRPHGKVVSALMHEFLESSVRREARSVVMGDLNPISRPEAAEHYRYMCESCHGAPGSENPPLSKGLYPPPPKLHVNESEWSEGELFWIIKHGIKFTGMPGFGSDHSDAELWGLATFGKELNDLSAEDYTGFFSAETAPAKGGSSHDHHGHHH